MYRAPTGRRGKQDKRGKAAGSQRESGEIPRLRGPTRQKSARKKKSGRSARDDKGAR
jgi:hypothetical protein